MSAKQYCRYFNNPCLKIPRMTEYRLRKKERIERLAKDYVIITNKNTESILTHSIDQEIDASTTNNG